MRGAETVTELVYGIHSVEHELLFGRRHPKVLYHCEACARGGELLALAQRCGVAVQTVSRIELERLTGASEHQGVALRVDDFCYLSLEELVHSCRDERHALLLIMDGITDARNFGAILRSADAAGCRGVIIAKDRACPVTATVHKVSSGALAHVAVCRVVNLARAMEYVKEAGFWIFGLAAESAEPLFGQDLRGKVALVMGNEEKGLRPQVRRECDMLLSIPMQGRVSSLNVSVAASIAMFEVVRQRL